MKIIDKLIIIAMGLIMLFLIHPTNPLAAVAVPPMVYAVFYLVYVGIDDM